MIELRANTKELIDAGSHLRAFLKDVLAPAKEFSLVTEKCFFYYRSNRYGGINQTKL